MPAAWWVPSRSEPYNGAGTRASIGGESGYRPMMSPMPSRIASPWVSVNWPLSRNANWMRRPRSNTPASPVTPSSEPVFPRKLPSSGVPMKSATSVPLRPATGSPS